MPKNWFWLQKLLGPVLLMSEVQVKVQFRKALPALGNSGALETPAPLILLLKSSYAVMVVFL